MSQGDGQAEKSDRETALQGAFVTNLIFFLTNLMVARKICEAVSQSTEGILNPLRLKTKDQVAKMGSADWDELKKSFLSGNMNLPEKGQVVRDFTDAIILSNRAPMFTNEMSLEFIVSSFEALLTNDIKAVLEQLPGKLGSKDKSMNFEELLDIKSMDDLKDALIEREIRVANKGGPDDFRRYIKNRIGFDISGEDWEELCECFQRRNLLVHNDLYPDRKYLAEVATSKKGERLIVDHKYLNEGFDLFERYAESITQQFHAQYCGDISFTKGSMKLQISPEELQSLIMKFVDTGHLPSSGM